jgi:hypothetical protein
MKLSEINRQKQKFSKLYEDKVPLASTASQAHVESAYNAALEMWPAAGMGKTKTTIGKTPGAGVPFEGLEPEKAIRLVTQALVKKGFEESVAKKAASKLVYESRGQSYVGTTGEASTVAVGLTIEDIKTEVERSGKVPGTPDFEEEVRALAEQLSIPYSR